MLRPGPYRFGAQVTLADICLVPQVSNARRLKVPLDTYPKIVAVDAACVKLPAFERRGPRTSPTRSEIRGRARANRLKRQHRDHHHLGRVVLWMTGALLSFSRHGGRRSAGSRAR